MLEDYQPLESAVEELDFTSAREAVNELDRIWGQATLLDGPKCELSVASWARSLLGENDPFEPYDAKSGNRPVVWSIYRDEVQFSRDTRLKYLRCYWETSHRILGPEPKVIPEDERLDPVDWCADRLGVTSDEIELWLNEPGRFDVYEAYRILEDRTQLLHAMHRQRIGSRVETLKHAVAAILNEPTRGQGRKKSMSDRLRRLIRERDDETCQKCGGTEEDRRERFPDNRSWMEVDHATPVSVGGPDQPWNLTLLCHRCNQRKGRAVEPWSVQASLDRLEKLLL